MRSLTSNEVAAVTGAGRRTTVCKPTPPACDSGGSGSSSRSSSYSYSYSSSYSYASSYSYSYSRSWVSPIFYW